MRKLLLLSLLIFLIQCGDDTRYFLNYDENKRVFRDEVSKNETKGIMRYYEVHYKLGKLMEFAFFRSGELIRKHELLHDDPKYDLEQKNLDSMNRLDSIEYYNNSSLVKKVVYTSSGKVWREMFYSKLENIKEYNEKDLLTKVIEYPAEGLKTINYYKYIMKNNKINRVADVIEDYEGNQLVLKLYFDYNKKGMKTKIREFEFDKLRKISYYDKDGYVSEEHEYNEQKKLIFKTLYSKGKKIKEIKYPVKK